MELSVVFLLLLAFLQFGDAWTTMRILKEGGRELNPVMNFLFGKLGILPTFIVMKTLVVLAFAYANIWWATAGMCVFYSWVVWNNWKQIKKTEASR